jgi:hypothetical protein
VIVVRVLGALVLGAAVLVAPAPAMAAQTGPAYECSSAAYQDDWRLGPANLPVLGVIGAELRGYQRTGGEPATQFLGTYYDDGWSYPPQDGYQLDLGGQPIKAVVTLHEHTGIDRYGSEFGGFLAPAGSAYRARSIPPSNLNGPDAFCDYYAYLVLRPFQVEAGPVAAWFGQPGGGTQYELDGSLVPGAPEDVDVRWLVQNDYLQRVRGVPGCGGLASC